MRFAVVACLSVLAAAGCGSEDEGAPIPADQAAVLQSQLDNVQARLDNGSVGACRDVAESDDPNTIPVRQAIDSLPESVDADVRQTLDDGFARLFELVQERCEELEAAEREQQQGAPAPAPEPVEPETTPEEKPPKEKKPKDEEGEDGEELPPGQGPDGEGPPGQETDPEELVPDDSESGGGTIVPEDGG